MADSQSTRSREIRVALILYGGISLAVYENGVTRCFHELVRSRGLFGLLLELLDSSATVDVVAGTSAGGINGLILGACLESGADFADTANLWRRLGDLGDLLRDAGGSHQAASLIDGEGYYQKQLLEEFQKLCTLTSPAYESPGEMDVFITGTDYGGHPRRYVDGLGALVEDKEHRTVFHLAHRPGRKSLGVALPKRQVDPDKPAADPLVQGAILASIARVTSSFPVAFPPFQVKDIGDAFAPAVSQALKDTSGVDCADKAIYVDGGVLDNKPFGPALQAIFHRMPGGPVDRRLFYVEPDPVPFAGSKASDPTPLTVGLSSLSTLPAYESIAGDLDELRRHNERIDWLEQLKEKLLQSTAPAAEVAGPAYLLSRLDSAARSLALEADGAPSACDVPPDGFRRQLLAALQAELEQRARGDAFFLDPWDVHFQMRRAFHVLYDYYRAVSAGGAAPTTHIAMLLVGRLIKALKLIRDHMIVFNREAVGRIGSSVDRAAAARLLDEFVQYLDAGAPMWKGLRDTLPDPSQPLELERYAKEPKSFLPSTTLTQAAERADHLPTQTPQAPRESILARLGLALEQVVKACDGGHAERFERFASLDAQLYPLEFCSGVYELDRVEFVRISPADAQLGLSSGPPGDKVAGDELAHFAAFLRRDWRTNDILYGRLDGICQILRALLDTDALERALRRGPEVDALFEPARLEAWLAPCPQKHREAVGRDWNALRQAWERAGKKWGPALDDVRRVFVESLIRAGQEQAVGQDLEKVLADVHFQEIAYGYTAGPRGVWNSAKASMIERDAEEAARQDMQQIAPERRSEVFADMRLGAEAIAGPKGRVPRAVIGEYATQAYLLVFGMLQRSLGPRSGRILAAPRTRMLFHSPPRVIYGALVLTRQERSFAASLLWLVGGGALASLAAWWLLSGELFTTSRHWQIVLVSTVSLVLVCLLVLRSTGRHRRPKWSGDSLTRRAEDPPAADSNRGA